MPSPPILDIPRLREPIAGDNPCGRDLRADASANSVYYEIRTNRGSATTGERNVENNAFPGDAADIEKAKRETLSLIPKYWDRVFRLSEKALLGESKDLDLTTWLIEAAVRIHGFPGLRDAFALCADLIESYWDNIYPRPEDEDDDGTIAMLGGLAGRGGTSVLLNPIRRCEIADSLEFSASFADLAATGPDGPSRQQVEQAVRASSPTFIDALRDDLRDSIEAIRRTEESLSARLGQGAPSFSSVREELSRIREFVISVVGEGGDGATMTTPGGETAAPGESEPPTLTAGSRTLAVPTKPGQIGSREEAFSRLLEVAKYFEKVEPHSPIAFAIEDVVRRGRMNLVDLMEELIPNEDARRIFYTTAGIKPK